MPELPDLTVYADNLSHQVKDIPIASMQLFFPRCAVGAFATFSENAKGARIQNIIRNGKELFFVLNTRMMFSVHFMLSGKTTLLRDGDTEAIGHKMASVRFDNGLDMVFSDVQHMMKITVNPRLPSVPDALSDAFTMSYFSEILKKNAKSKIKELLIDQKSLRGIGNAYADEILYAARISPGSVCGKIPVDRAAALYSAIHDVLTDAIASIRRIAPGLYSGEERSFLKVHNKNLAMTESGEPIKVDFVAQKKTYYTEGQVLYK